MANIWRGIGETSLRVIPALVGGYLGGAKGAQIGYELGETASDSLFQPLQKSVTDTTYSPFNQMDAYSDNAQGRTKTTDTYNQTYKTGLEKSLVVYDTVNAAALNSPLGEGKFKKTNTDVNNKDIPNIANNSIDSKDSSLDLDKIQIPKMKELPNDKGTINSSLLDSGSYMQSIHSFLDKVAPNQFKNYKSRITSENDLSPYNTNSILNSNNL